MTDLHDQRAIKEEKMTYFLALEANDGSHHYLEINDATQTEAEQFLEDAFEYTHYRAVYLFDAVCIKCRTLNWMAGCDYGCEHEFKPATHLDFVHCRIDVDETKKGVER
jgi:hypothetical protein